MASLNEISVAQLLRLIGTPNAPAIVEACIDPDFAAYPRLFPTRFRACGRGADTDRHDLAPESVGLRGYWLYPSVFPCFSG